MMTRHISKEEKALLKEAEEIAKSGKDVSEFFRKIKNMPVIERSHIIIHYEKCLNKESETFMKEIEEKRKALNERKPA